MAFKNWKKKKVISPNSIHVPKYYGLDASLGFFCECGFVGSFSIPRDANALEAKHHDNFYNPFKVDSLVQVTYSNSHAIKPCGVDEGFDLKKKDKHQLLLPSLIMLPKTMSNGTSIYP
jgi:hypothetical protein